MSKIKIITDSASDLSVAEEAAYGIRVLPFPVILGGKSYISRVDFDNDGFYRLMAQYPDELPATAQITPYEFQQIMQEEVEAGNDALLFILINSEGSATYSNAVLAKSSFLEENPAYRDKVRIEVVDSRGYSAIYGYPVAEAAKRAQAGGEFEEIVDDVRTHIEKRQIYFGIYSLKYAGKSGRIPSAAAFLGDKLGLKPVMKLFDHQITTTAKARGESKLIPVVADLCLRDMAPATPYQVIYGCESEDRDRMAARMTERLGYGPSGFYQIGAAIAANAGPRVIGVCFDIL